MIFGLFLVGGGYALFYYGFDVLRWAHTDATGEPVTLAMCFGIPSDGTRTTPFMPPFNVGATEAGTIHDAKGLLGGTTTAALTNISATGGGGEAAGNNVTSNTAENNADPGAAGGTTGQPGAGVIVPNTGAGSGTFNPDPSLYTPGDAANAIIGGATQGFINQFGNLFK